MNKLVIVSLFMMAMLSSCNQYRVEGKASTSRLDLDGRMMYIKYMDDTQNWHCVDSCEIVHGKFEMSGRVDSVVMATLFMGSYNILPLVIEKGTIKVMLDEWSLNVSGTELNDRLYKFLNDKKSIEQKADELSHKHSLMIMNGTLAQEAENMLNREGQILSHEMDRLIIDFIVNNFDNVLGYEAFMMVVNSMPYPTITPEIQEIIDKAPAEFKEKSHVKAFLSEARPL